MFKSICCSLLFISSLLPSTVADDVLLITSTELKPSWKPFADWKMKSGKSVKIITVDEISKVLKTLDMSSILAGSISFKTL